MTDTSTPANGGEPMRAVVDNYGNLPRTSYEMPEDLKPYAEQVLKIDPLHGVPGNVQMTGGDRAPISLKATGLPPELRSEVFRKLEALPKMDAADRAKYEHKFVKEAVEGQLGGIRAHTGLGPDALPYHKQQVEIAGIVNDLVRKRQTYVDGVEEIARLRKASDPVTGEMVAEPVYRLSGFKRANYNDAIAEIDQKISLFIRPDGTPGIEAQKLLKEAHIESAFLLQKRDRARTEEAEARQLAEQQMREDRIAKRAADINKMQTGR